MQTNQSRAREVAIWSLCWVCSRCWMQVPGSAIHLCWLMLCLKGNGWLFPVPMKVKKFDVQLHRQHRHNKLSNLAQWTQTYVFVWLTRAAWTPPVEHFGKFGSPGMYSFVSHQQYQSAGSMHKPLCCSLPSTSSKLFSSLQWISQSLFLKPRVNDCVLTETKNEGACNFILQ